MLEWIANLKIGEKVFVTDDYSTELLYLIARNRKGEVRVSNGDWFNADGKRIRCDELERDEYLKEATEERIAAYYARKKRLENVRVIRAWIDSKNVSDETLQKIADEIRKGKTQDETPDYDYITV
jgi:hypothetical protein